MNVTRPCPGCPLASQIVMRVEQDMEAPIHIYYILHNFYQNHKRYVRSANYNQMHGEDSGSSSLKPCIPRLYVTGEGDGNFTNNGLVKPCGLVSWSTFNDTFTNFRVRHSLTRFCSFCTWSWPHMNLSVCEIVLGMLKDDALFVQVGILTCSFQMV